jgi:hypothetical protein
VGRSSVIGSRYEQRSQPARLADASPGQERVAVGRRGQCCDGRRSAPFACGQSLIQGVPSQKAQPRPFITCNLVRMWCCGEVGTRDASAVVLALTCHLTMAHTMADQQIPQAHAAADSIQSAVESTSALVLRQQ